METAKETNVCPPGCRLDVLKMKLPTIPTDTSVPILTDAASAPEWRERLVRCLVMTEYHNTLSEHTAPPGWRWSKALYPQVTWDQQQTWATGLVLPTIARQHWGKVPQGEETIAALWNRLNNKFKATQAEIAGYYRLPSLESGFTADEAEGHLCLFEQRFILLAACGVKLTDDMKIGMFVASLPKDWDLDFLGHKRTWAEYSRRFTWMAEPHSLGKKQAAQTKVDRGILGPGDSPAVNPKTEGSRPLRSQASSSKLGKAPHAHHPRDASVSSSNRQASTSGPHPSGKPTAPAPSASVKPQTATSKFGQSNPFDVLVEADAREDASPPKPAKTTGRGPLANVSPETKGTQVVSTSPTKSAGQSSSTVLRESAGIPIVEPVLATRVWCSHCQVPGHHVSKCRRKAMGAPKRQRRKVEARKPAAATAEKGDGDNSPEMVVAEGHASLINPTDLVEALGGVESQYWSRAMELEMDRLRENGTIQEATPPKGQHTSLTDWVFARQVKRDLAKYRCRLIALTEERTDTAAMGSLPALRVMLAYGASVGMRFRHLSVDMSVPLPEPVYVTAPHLDHLFWKVHKMLRGMKGSGKAIDRAIRECLLASGFKKCKEGGMFVLPSPQGRPRAVLFQYGDELVVGSWAAGLKAVLPTIKAKFKDHGSIVDDLGDLTFFMGIGIECFPHNCDILLEQNHYIDHILAGVPELEGLGERTVPLTLETLDMLAAAEPETANPVDRKWWRKIVGRLCWLARCTRPDIAFAAAYLSRFSASTTLGPAHRAALLDVLAYLRTRRDFELKLGAEEDSAEPHEMWAFSHGFVGASIDKSHIGWRLMLDGSTVDWASHKSNVAGTALEADLVAQGEAAHRLAWLHELLHELGVVASKHGALFGDNCGVIDNQAALVHVLQSNKHVLTEYQFMLELEQKDRLRLHGSDASQPAKLCSMPTTGSDFKRYCLMYGLERQLSISQVELMRSKTEEEVIQHLLWDEEEGEVDVLVRSLASGIQLSEP
ncbi:hypothetical protein CspeluHIS016_0407990 [Cutaneotrichosporon spelunceum]|uniref:Reverse transcriptase Ty1/copia-type domain-containing protein n=1 Tax=Cutaneotrichosporon spelunceum TaxID=1672016 RepID=A0AAD3YCC4_9TREE|nr:hypothetical protein CspeluHIS016_0407990 [Cutaneotrichosporon spelunceum]